MYMCVCGMCMYVWHIYVCVCGVYVCGGVWHVCICVMYIDVCIVYVFMCDVCVCGGCLQAWSAMDAPVEIRGQHHLVVSLYPAPPHLFL